VLIILACGVEGKLYMIKILIIRPDAIGDFILWLDAAKVLRKLYPSTKYEITLLGNNIWTSITNTLLYFDKVIPLNRKKYLSNLIYHIKTLWKIRKQKYDIVINPVYSREFIFDILVRFSDAKERIGFDGDYCNISLHEKKLGDMYYTRLIPSTKQPLMELDRNAEFIQGLGLKNFKANIPELMLNPTNKLSDYYVISIGANNLIRQWPVEKYAELAKRIYTKTNMIGMVCGSKEDQLLAKELFKLSIVPLIDMTGKTSLLELLSTIASTKFVVGNETGSIHIAASLKIPSFCITGGGHYGRFVPYLIESEYSPIVISNKMDCFGCNWQCIYDTAMCVTNISVDDVVDKIIDRLSHQ
jgi:ADP-heptose:LPS heptosyltransferase